MDFRGFDCLRFDAITLAFHFTIGCLQSSIDLLQWANEGEMFEGTGAKSLQSVEASRSLFYWRLALVDEPSSILTP